MYSVFQNLHEEKERRRSGNFFGRDRHSRTEFTGCIWGDENDGKIKKYRFHIIFCTGARIFRSKNEVCVVKSQEKSLLQNDYKNEKENNNLRLLGT